MADEDFILERNQEDEDEAEDESNIDEDDFIQITPKATLPPSRLLTPNTDKSI